jgi:DNA-binding NarL/FixJ family response regulator
MQNILAKLGVSSRAAAISDALTKGLLSPDG